MSLDDCTSRALVRISKIGLATAVTLSGCGADRSEGTDGFGPAARSELGSIVETISGVPGEWHFGRVSAIALRNDTLWVVDRAEKVVVAVDLSGELLYEYGREGDGPEEFRLPYEVHASSDGSIWILDSQAARVVRLSHAGNLLEVRRLPFAATSFGIFQNGTEHDVVVPGPSSNEPLLFIGTDSTYTVSFGTVDESSPDVPWFAPGRILISTVAPDSILVADGQTGRVWGVRRAGYNFTAAEISVPEWMTSAAMKLREERVASLGIETGSVQMSLYTDIGAAGTRAWLRPIGSDQLALRLDVAGRDTALVASRGTAMPGLADLVRAGDTAVVAFDTEIHVYTTSPSR